MGRAVLLGLALLAAFLTFMVMAGRGEARCGWKCIGREVKGLRHQYLPTRMRRLEARLEAQDSYISWLEERSAHLEARLSTLIGCLGEVPLSRYGEELGPSGYLFKFEALEGPLTLATTALDVSYPGDPVGVWALVNTCNSARIKPQSALVPTGQGQAALGGESQTPGPVLRWRRAR